MESYGSEGAVGVVEETPQIISGIVDFTTGDKEAVYKLVKIKMVPSMPKR